MVRTLSTEKVKAGEEGADSFKFSRLVSFENIFFNWRFVFFPQGKPILHSRASGAVQRGLPEDL